MKKLAITKSSRNGLPDGLIVEVLDNKMVRPLAYNMNLYAENLRDFINEKGEGFRSIGGRGGCYDYSHGYEGLLETPWHPYIGRYFVRRDDTFMVYGYDDSGGTGEEFATLKKCSPIVKYSCDLLPFNIDYKSYFMVHWHRLEFLEEQLGKIDKPGTGKSETLHYVPSFPESTHTNGESPSKIIIRKPVIKLY